MNEWKAMVLNRKIKVSLHAGRTHDEVSISNQNAIKTFKKWSINKYSMPSFERREMNEKNNFRIFIHLSCLIILTKEMKRIFPLIGSLSGR